MFWIRVIAEVFENLRGELSRKPDRKSGGSTLLGTDLSGLVLIITTDLLVNAIAGSRCEFVPCGNNAGIFSAEALPAISAKSAR